MKSKTRTQSSSPLMALISGLALTAGAASAQTTVLADNFEAGTNPYGGTTPDVASYTVANTSGQANTTLWVRAASGFNSSRNGLIDETENGGANFTDPVGEQAYGFRYTNTGLTTAEGKIGALTLGTTISVSFDVCIDGFNAGNAYDASLVLFDPGATRNSVEVYTNNTAAVLARTTGTTTATNPYQTITFSYTVGNNVVDNDGAGGGTATSFLYSLLGKDIALRFDGATNSANIDNVSVTIDYSNLSYWDTNGATEGAGDAAPSGTWNAATTNWNPEPAGTGAAAPWSPGEFAVFAAGTDATGNYIVTVDGPQNISGLLVEEGSIDFANGTVGALNLMSNTDVLVPSGSTVSIATPITDADDTQVLQKVGTGLLVLSADNSAANGGTQITQGTIRFESPSSINGTAENVTIASGGTLAFGTLFGAGNIPATLDRIVTTSAGTIAADNFASTNFDFSDGGGSGPNLTAAYLGAVVSVNYTGTLTPNGTTYRLGGGGGTLTMANTDALTGATSAIIRGNVVLAGANNHSAGTTLNAGTNLTLGNNGSLGGGTLTLAGASTIQASATVTATNTVAANADFTVAGSEALTLSGAMTVNANRIITNTNTTATTTFGAISRDGSNNRNLTVNGAGNTTISGDLVLGTGTLTKNNAGYLTLEGANNYSGTTTINGGRLILKGSNSTAGTTTLVLNQLHLASANNGGLPSGSLTFGNATQFNAIIQAVNDDRTISNNLVLNNTHGSISGDYSLTVNGAFTNSGGNRTLTNGVVAGKSLTLAGQVNLSNDATSRTLTITGTGSTVISGQIVNGSTSTTGVLTKTGAGTLTLSNNTSSYGGATNVSAGKLFINGDQTAAAGNVNVTGTGVLGGTGIIGGTTSIANNCGLEFNLSTAPGSHDKLELAAGKTLTFSGASVLTITSSPGATTGLYTLVTAPGELSILGTAPATVNVPLGWTYDPPQIVADGPDTSLQINITSTGGGAPTYPSWSGGAAANVDTNGDGVDNGVAWALGAEDPNENAIGLVPTMDNTSDPTYVIFNFNRADIANDDPSTTITVEYGNNLAGWITAVDDNDNVDIIVTPGSPTDGVQVKLKRSTLGSGGKLFARLNVKVTP